MAAWGYEFYLRVLKVSLTRERYFQYSKLNSYPRAAMYYPLFISHILRFPL